MLYRVIIKSASNKMYYLVDNNTAPAVDSFVTSDDVQFSLDIVPTQAHAFSTRQLALDAIASLPYPYNGKAVALEVETQESPLAEAVYYRVVKHPFWSAVHWAKNDGTFDVSISQETALLATEEEAKAFQDTLSGWDSRISMIVKSIDYRIDGEYSFEIHYVDRNRPSFRCSPSATEPVFL